MSGSFYFVIAVMVLICVSGIGWTCWELQKSEAEPEEEEAPDDDELPQAPEETVPRAWRRPTIYAIDFDGTIVENEFPKIGKIIPEAEEFIRELHARGNKWILYTMREGESLQQALEFLAMIDLLPDAVNDNLPEMCQFYGNNPRKIFANVYIDDHNAGGLRFESPSLKQARNR